MPSHDQIRKNLSDVNHWWGRFQRLIGGDLPAHAGTVSLAIKIVRIKRRYVA